MKLKNHKINGAEIAEITADKPVFETVADGTDLLGNLYYQGFDKVILHAENISPGFFDLKTGIAGEILQKFTNHRVQLAIVGDFTKYSSKSLHDFILESNKGRQINFFSTTSEALNRLSKN